MQEGKNKKENKQQQSRGSELREKMQDSQKKGEKFRAEHEGADTMKAPNTSNTQKSHKK